MKVLYFFFLICLSKSVLSLVKCPDKVSACPDGTTCCPLEENTYGCCPIPKAVCCEDQRHCCPHDSRCDTAHGRCLKHSNGDSIPMFRKTEAFKLDLDEISSEEFGIPVKGNDDSEENEDSRVQLSFPQPNAPTFSQKRNPFKTQRVNNDVTCQDGKSKCPSGTTCCVLGGGMYGCCPIPGAVCCEDHLHCCPHDTKCDTAEGRCINPRTLESSPWYKKFAATKVIQKRSIKLNPSSRPCAEGYCEGHQACCSPAFARNPTCCPFSGGVCCKSGCCPKGYKCAGSSCVVETDDITVSAPKSVLIPGRFFESSEIDFKICEDGSNCPLKSTCCPVEDEGGAKSFKCCPLKQGICCEKSCCPRGFHCGQEGICERAALTKDLLKELLFASL